MKFGVEFSDGSPSVPLPDFHIGITKTRNTVMQSLIVLDIDTAEKVMVAVAGGVGYVIRPVKTMLRNQHAWELRGSKAQCDYLEVACIALDVVYYRIDTTTATGGKLCQKQMTA